MLTSPPATLRLVGAVCLLTPALGSAQTARGPRAEMDGFAAALDAAVRRVSRPSFAMLAGRGSARAYRLPGYGAFFVLAPRALPVRPPGPAAELSAARAVEEAIRHLEKGLQTAASPQMREQMEKNLQALRATRAELRSPSRDRSADTVLLATPGGNFTIAGSAELTVSGRSIATETGEEQAMLRLEQLRRALETQMAEHLRALQAAARTSGEPEREVARRMEAQVLELQAQMEAVRREAEEARLEAERQVEMRLAFPPLPEVAGAPEPPEAALTPPAPGVPVSAPDVAGVPAPTLPPTLPPAPWQYWFSMEEPADGRTEEALVRDVKAALTGLLEARGSSLRQLAPEECVTVAVDFVPRTSSAGSRVQKTLVVKVKKRDLDERRAGRLTGDQLRRRIEYAEY